MPVPAPLQLPAVDDVADEIEVAAVGALQEFEERPGLASRRAEMDVGDEDGAESQRRAGLVFKRNGSIHSQPIVGAAQVNCVSVP